MIANPLGRLTEDRRLTEKYPCEEWVKSGEELSQLFTSRNPSVYRGFRRFGEEWRVKERVGIFSPDVTFCAWQWHDIALVKGNVMP